MRTIELNGDNFSNLSEFYSEVERKMTSGLSWKIGRNLDAFNDVLNGGFGVHEVDENYELKWLNSKKSKTELGKATEPRTDGINCGMPILGITLTFWIFGTVAAIATHIIWKIKKRKSTKAQHRL